MLHILKTHPELIPYRKDLELRADLYKKKKKQLLGNKRSLKNFANAHKYYGFHRQRDGWVYREWAPAADRLFLTGDFNDWRWTDTPMTRLDGGNWELFLPGDILKKGSRVLTVLENGDRLTQHVPLYARRVTQDWVTQSWC